MSNKQQGLTRSYQFLAGFVEQEGVKLRNPDAPCGNAWNEEVPESLQDARVRYARKFVLCLDRAMLSQTSVIVVSHGESLPGCLPLFRDYRSAEVVSTPFCGMVIGRLEQSLAAKRRSAQLEFTRAPSTADANAIAGILDGLSVIETNCEVREIPSTSPAHAHGHLPAWMRARKVRFRAGSTALMQALGISSSRDESHEVRSKEMQRPSTQANVEGRASFMLDNMIECDEVTKLDDDFESGLANLVELPAVPSRKEVYGSSSQMHCVVGASTLLLGDFVVGPSSTFIEGESLRSLKSVEQVTAASGGAEIWSDSAGEEISRRRRDNLGELSPRGVRGPTQQRGPYNSNGCARRAGRRHPSADNNSLPSSAEKLSSELIALEPDPPETEMTKGGETASSAQPPTEEIQALLRAGHGGLPFSQDAATPVPASATPVLGSSTPGDSRGLFNELRVKQSARAQKWSLSLSTGGRSASVVPVYEEASPCSAGFASISPTPDSSATCLPTSLGSPSVDSAGGIKRAQLSPAAVGSINLSKVATNSLFQRRRSRGGAA
jgi:hypothetical protein